MFECLIMWVVCLAVFLVLLPISIFLYHRRNKSDKWNKGASYWDYTVIHNGVILKVMGVAGVASVIFALLFVIGSAYLRHDNDQLYIQLSSERAWYESLLTVSDTDAARDEAYRQIAKYNTRIVERQTQFNDPYYMFEFSDNYNWNELPLILAAPSTEVPTE